MSLLSFLLNSLYRSERSERQEIKLSCQYGIYLATNTEPIIDTLRSGLIINISNRGFGLISEPPLQKEEETKISKKPHKIYIEVFSNETGTTLKMHGEIRWVKSILDVKKPYTEFGIYLTSVKDDSKTELINSLF